MFNKVLVANRGEIALRIIRACRELGVASVAVYSEADVDSMHVQLADEAVCIGPGPSQDSYLKPDRIIAAAEITGADAIHPGYGFLSENARFVEICESCNIKFIGPSAEVIRRMGDKNTARATAVEFGVPITPGSDGILESAEHGLKLAKDMGFPVMIKATAGGGGRGMRPCFDEKDFVSLYDAASKEAIACFGNGDCYLEKLVMKPHHIEMQIIGDTHGNFIQLGERDCSMQRRNQKIIEECPSPLISDKMRVEMAEASVNLIKSIGYENAGTIEYLVDEKAENFYFMEMNTRIQVEHPVTEEVMGCELIKEQIRVAAGEPLSSHVLQTNPRGHSIECRINAEDPYNNFCPSPGKITLWYTPGGKGVRLDTHVYSGYSVPPYYDSMIAKLIVTGATREIAISRMKRALSEFKIEGIKTTIPFQQEIIDHPDFKNGDYGIEWVADYMKSEGLQP
ncbi:acetyl-CoA carboxylase biotin carboxylase subunit [Verrucomicrobiaceae bacterium R5-34]|uniref:Biotin carboxylase n=1 Tax=Oceaniferula flava TaxID=2800421 RepID=A0AAE2V9K2_9BACT|nr:acetyl-CoA carboxylase biotin carboxylase subunit [Oceaniferula flavus]MBK1831964.1 acetyl-CoA carboxylase biotin carboxylase subunit [Verrucomicrobiaceae bacterium R5-34]MBK1855268.1 acetyl-CoA carboxylase biotin carboxylase subunit [Oceaniferula flavus]MBM1136574.1 acetyl-CoA carboxylase biotin carboxylase subunit [Oceaniferula flavus]